MLPTHPARNLNVCDFREVLFVNMSFVLLYFYSFGMDPTVPPKGPKSKGIIIKSLKKYIKNIENIWNDAAPKDSKSTIFMDKSCTNYVKALKIH